MKRVLVLGAGLVVKPLLDYLLACDDVELRLATLNIDRARQLLDGRARAVALQVNAADQDALLPEVSGADVVVSLLPADQHVQIAEACLAHGVPLITTSYVSDAMRGLHDRAVERGVLLLNETGLDPGLDHMSAVRAIRRAQAGGSRVISFVSYCGALPAPDSNTNPWGYKFAWSPRGVLVAASQPVRYIERGEIAERTFPDLFADPRRILVPGIGPLESYPNRDCLRYRELYGLQHAHDFFRGTLRHPGWSETWRALADLGLLDVTPRSYGGLRYAEFLERHLPFAAPGAVDAGGLVYRLANALHVSSDHDIIARFEWLGLLSDRFLPEGAGSSLDVMAVRLQEKLRYRSGEHDMVVLEHQLVFQHPDGRLARGTTRLVEFGDAGDDSALARTVSLPAAIACRLILDGRVSLTGVRIPIDPQLSEPILDTLETLGIRVVETRST